MSSNVVAGCVHGQSVVVSRGGGVESPFASAEFARQDGDDFLEVGMRGGAVDLGSSTATRYEQDDLTYQPNVWNLLRVRFDLDKQKAHIRLNGQETTFAC